MPAGIIEADLAACQAAVCVELVNLTRVNRNHMCHHITGVAIGIRRAALDQVGHVAIGASDLDGNVPRVVLELGFLPVAILALQVSGLHASDCQLHHSRVGIMAGEAI